MRVCQNDRQTDLIEVNICKMFIFFKNLMLVVTTKRRVSTSAVVVRGI